MYFFFNDTATTEIYTLSLHDALPIYERIEVPVFTWPHTPSYVASPRRLVRVSAQIYNSSADYDRLDRKSTRLNSSHANISYAVFCLKKKTKNDTVTHFILWHSPDFAW